MKSSITGIFLGAYLAATLVLGIFLSILLSANQTDLLMEAAVARGNERGLVLLRKFDALPDPLSLSSDEDLSDYLSTSGIHVADARLLDEYGSPVFENTAESEPLFPDDVQVALARQEFEGRLFHSRIDPAHSALYLFLPCSFQAQTGVLYVSLDLPELRNGLIRLRVQIVVTLAGVFLLLVALTLLVWNRVVRPVTRISRQVVGIIGNEEHDPLPEGRADEIGTLCRDINRMETAIRIAELHSRSVNPLTGLPGNVVIERTVSDRLAAGDPVCVIYADLDYFKSYNDYYGIARGDEVLSLTARIFQETMGEFADPFGFVGHYGGDDFILICSADNWEPLCAAIATRFDAESRALYDAEDRERGGIVTKNRRGETETFPFVSISLAAVTNRHRALHGFSEVSTVASEMKKVVKAMPGSAYAIDRRGE